ncbi:MAG: glycosyltransferase family 4 protein [Bryobacteraceae bacterium]|nr:glycosyltransferase family 4 protein [Bryobacteraceae bacterium]
MRVALDATPLTLRSGGLRRYVEELSRALARANPEDDYSLVCDFPFEMPADAPPNLQAGTVPAGALWRRWWLAGVQREMARRGCELFHGTNFVVPWMPLRPSVATVHDVSPWMEQWAEMRDGLSGAGTQRRKSSSFVRSRAGLQIAVGLASMVLTPTEAVRKEVVEYFRVHPSRVVSAPLAAGPVFRPTEGKKLERPYFLHVGAAGPRKNLSMLMQAWHEVQGRTGAELVLAGPLEAGMAAAGDDARSGLRQLGHVSDDELAEWYSGAAAVLYPSFYEGFGLPVLEAMQCGAAVIASRIPAVEEVAADGAVLLNPKDTKAWAEAMTASVRNPERFAELRWRALRRASGFTWERTARLTREVYAEALQRWEMRSFA